MSISGRSLSVHANVRTGLILLAVGIIGGSLALLGSRFGFLVNAIPVASLFVFVLPVCAAYVMIVTAALLGLDSRESFGAKTIAGAFAVLLFVAAGLAVYVPWQTGALRGTLAAGLSSDAVALTVVSGIIGVGFGLAAHRTVPARAYLFGVVVPFAFSWPDYHGVYTVITGAFDPVLRGPQSRVERFTPAGVAEVQASGAIALQFAAAAVSAILGVALGMVVRRLASARRAAGSRRSGSHRG